MAAPPAAGACRYRLVLEYDGTDFEGWQVQPGGRRTVQAVLEDAVAQVTGARVRVAAAGRTDAGVHAEGQLAGVTLATRLAPDDLRRALNAVLPRDVAVRALTPAPEGFDPRRWARAKLYRYQVWNGPDRSPRREREWLHVPRPLDVAAMARAARDLEGRHDFAAFQATGSDVRHTVRELFRAELTGAAGGELRLEFEGDGFLRHMVRNLVGTLLQVGLGRRAPDSMPALLAGGDRSQAGPTAAARGLCLVRVECGEGPPPRTPASPESDEKSGP